MTAEGSRRSPLQDREDDLVAIGAREVPFLHERSVRTRRPETAGLPTEPNTWRSLAGPGTREALWLGPDEWLMLAARGEPDHTLWIGLGADDPLAAVGSVVELSANHAVLDLVRDDAHDPRRLLEQGCSLDLDPRSWAEGRCAQTLLARVPVILQERGSATRVLVRPSYASWLVDWLLAVAR